MAVNTTESEWVDEVLDLPFENTSKMILKFGSLIVFVFGLFGNVMILLIMHRLPVSGCSVLFQVLACSDQLLLSLKTLVEWLYLDFDSPLILSLGQWPCKLYRLAGFATGALSAWILVTITVQRAASVLWPHRVNAVWTKSKSRAVAVTLIVFFTLLHCHVLYGFRFDPDRCLNTSKCCELETETYVWFFNVIWSWVDLMEFSCLPFVIMIVGNSVLIWTLRASVSARKRAPVQQAAHDSRQRKASSLTVTLIMLSSTFLLLTTPVTIYQVTSPHIARHDPDVMGQYRLFRAVGMLMWYSNSAINFYLYCLTGRKFRTELRHIMSKCFRPFRQTK